MAQLLFALLFLTCAESFARAAGLGTVTFTNTRRYMFDVNGNQIDAVAGKVSFLNGKYYLYGNCAGGVNAYSSIDLVNWAHEGALGYGGSRSHIIYNPTSKNYIVWADGAGASGYLVGTSSSPASGYKAAGVGATDPAYASLQKADMAVEVINGKGYLVHSALNFQDPRAGSIWPQIYQTMHILQLTDDFLSTTKVSYNVTSAAFDIIDQQTESPDLFYRNGYYYVSASNTCGLCSGSIGLLYRSKSIQGPWTRQILAGYSYGAQVEGVLPLTDPTTNITTYVWHGNTPPGSSRTSINGHIFQPLQFNDDGSAKNLDCSNTARWDVNFTLGDGVVASGKATIAADGSPLLADYFMVCDSDAFNLYQTWTNSKSGTLKEIGINVVGSVQTGALELKVFKFSNLNDLVSPGYKWTLLNSTTVTRAQMSSSVLNVVSVFLNAAVKQGDMLGFSFGNYYPTGQFIPGGDPSPYCHLEYPTNSTTQILLEQGGGQNSARGDNGKTPPVVPRAGRAMKFYSIVQ